MAILDLIEHPNEMSGEIVRRVPEGDSGEFRLGSQLVVREGQRAIFVRDGKALDVFGPGRHTISTNNIPLLTGLIGLPFGGRSPFTAEVYFVSMREFTDMKWGTAQPVVYRDSELGMVRLRAFGTYAMRVADPQVFVGTVVGARGAYTTAAIDDFLKSVVINEFNDLLGEVQTSILDLQRMTGEIADGARHALGDDFQRLGLALTAFNISAITPPDEVMRRIDERSGMAALGDMGTYTQFQAAQALRDAAQNPGGAGDATSTGVGLGAGLGLGQAMAGAVRAGFAGQAAPQQAAPQQAAPAAAPATTTCPNCQATVAAGAKFCPNCGKALQAAPVVCPKCGTQNQAGAKFCTNCGTGLATGG
ncbi:MAG: Putative virion core protein (lumpy skin disease virus) [uncultured Thermomicrobiales bacterium]|uniref:Virion core protein (Lumpy skin disease virus) n=1 Tax=uncultured Thermomicrobiales bacterium TaxID=1645740 RepID=A0A6J4VBQ4_9BACT|nr:MAG: Putative virion core protein (lumpy skin disease virus) [uncultured Thermomicrobiales bacterium]